MNSNDGCGRRTVSRRTVLGRAALVSSAAVVGLPAVSGSAAARSDLVVPDDYATVQAAVDAAAPGDRVLVKDGTYQEQVVVDKHLTLTNAPGASPTIVAPSSPAQYTVAESGATWEPVVFAYGGTETSGAVSGADTNRVDIEGLTIDGNDRSPGARGIGLLLRNVVGDVADNTIENMHVGGRETFGIVCYGDSRLDIRGNQVSEYERGGIAANGNGVDPAPTARIRDNTVVGSTDLGLSWAPNGIQVGYGASADVKRNDVSDNRYSGSSWVASGILVFESDGVQIMDNTVTNSDIGIGSSAWGWFAPSADGTNVSGNEVEEANVAVYLAAVGFPEYSTMDASVSNNKVVNNRLTDPDTSDSDVGIYVSAYDASPNYDPVADNNKLIRNTITGFDTQVVDGGSDTKIQAIEP